MGGGVGGVGGGVGGGAGGIEDEEEVYSTRGGGRRGVGDWKKKELVISGCHTGY